MRILLFTAHPHYAGTLCAGTIANHTARGDEVFVVSVTHGELMTNRFAPAELAKVNEHEAFASAKILGVKDMRIWDYPDAGIKANDELCLDLNNAIREFKPDVILSHWKNDTHPDFRECGSAVIDACFYALLVSGKWNEKYQPHWTGKLYTFENPCLSVGFKADLLVDISAFLEKKLQSLHCFQAHIDANFMGNPEPFDSSILAPNRRWGLEGGAMYAEAFARVDIHEVHNKAVQYLVG